MDNPNIGDDSLKNLTKLFTRFSWDKKLSDLDYLKDLLANMTPVGISIKKLHADQKLTIALAFAERLAA